MTPDLARWEDEGGSCRERPATPKTRSGTPCSVCGRRIGKGRLEFYPYGTTCSGPCFVTETIRRDPILRAMYCSEHPSLLALELRTGTVNAP